MVLPAINGRVEGRDCGGEAGGVCGEFPGALSEELGLRIRPDCIRRLLSCDNSAMRGVAFFQAKNH